MAEQIETAKTGEQEYTAQMREKVLQTLATCINCRFCLTACPRFDITSGEMLQGASGITRSLYYAIKWNEKDKGALKELRDIVYSCMMCKSCEVTCKNSSTGTKLLDAIQKGREILVEEMIGPLPDQKKALESLEKYGNPYGMNSSERIDWLRALEAPILSDDTTKEILFFVGCTAPHDNYAGEMAKALVKLLNNINISYGIIDDEICCGHPAFTMGDSFAFNDIVERNVKKFKSKGIKSIVTLSPHCYDTFLNHYPSGKLDGIKIQHYTQLIADLIEDKKIKFQGKVEKRIAYHDPCYLGKHNGEYEAPRKILKAIPGIELVEFSKSKDNSICCGGGGGRMWADIETETGRLGILKAKEATSLGVDVIATSCPWCIINLIDGVKTENVDDKIRVADISELILEALS